VHLTVVGEAEFFELSEQRHLDEIFSESFKVSFVVAFSLSRDIEWSRRV
jgi:hypothetical protein